MRMCAVGCTGIMIYLHRFPNPTSDRYCISAIVYAVFLPLSERKLLEIMNKISKFVFEENFTIIQSLKKKTGLDNFDVPMGGYDSAQIADLVGLFILDT